MALNATQDWLRATGKAIQGLGCALMLIPVLIILLVVAAAFIEGMLLNG